MTQCLDYVYALKYAVLATLGIRPIQQAMTMVLTQIAHLENVFPDVQMEHSPKTTQIDFVLSFAVQERTVERLIGHAYHHKTVQLNTLVTIQPIFV